MSQRTETTQFYTCDLCGHEATEKDAFRSLTLTSRRVMIGTADFDICGGCMSQPVARLFAWFDARKLKSPHAESDRLIADLTKRST